MSKITNDRIQEINNVCMLASCKQFLSNFPGNGLTQSTTKGHMKHAHGFPIVNHEADYMNDLYKDSIGTQVDKQIVIRPPVYEIMSEIARQEINKILNVTNVTQIDVLPPQVLDMLGFMEKHGLEIADVHELLNNMEKGEF